MIIDFTTNVGMFKKGNCDIAFQIYDIYVRFFVAVRKYCKKMSLKTPEKMTSTVRMVQHAVITHALFVFS